MKIDDEHLNMYHYGFVDGRMQIRYSILDEIEKLQKEKTAESLFKQDILLRIIEKEFGYNGELE